MTHKDCGVALYNIHGWFTTRDLDNDTLYDTYLDCLWIILPRDNLTTILRVTEIDIEQSASCYFDYLKVRNYFTWAHIERGQGFGTHSEKSQKAIGFLIYWYRPLWRNNWSLVKYFDD